MNDYVEKYCNFIRRKTERVLKKTFGYKSIRDGFDEKKRLVHSLENSVGKRICDFDENDVKKAPYLYAKYKTISKILTIYVNSIVLGKFTEKKECEYEYY